MLNTQQKRQVCETFGKFFLNLVLLLVGVGSVVGFGLTEDLLQGGPLKGFIFVWFIVSIVVSLFLVFFLGVHTTELCEDVYNHFLDEVALRVAKKGSSKTQ